MRGRGFRILRLGRTAFTGAALAAVLTLALFGVMSGDLERGERTSEATSTANAVLVAEELIEEHDCWSGQAPAARQGSVPGHVIAAVRPGRVPVYSAQLVGPALDQVFGGGSAEHPELVVHAFCR